MKITCIANLNIIWRCINIKAVSVSSPCCRRSSSPTWSIRSRRARLLTSAAARLSPQTCFRLPHCLGRFAPCGFSRPPALRRADYRLPPVIVMPLWIVLLLPVMVMASGESSRSTSASVVFYLLVLLVYIGKRDSSRTFISLLYIVLLGILRLLMIPAFGEILHPTSSSGGARRSLSSTRSRWNVCAAARKAG